MRKKAVWMIGAVLAVVIIALIYRQLSPQSLLDILSVEQASITDISCTASISGINGDGEVYTEQFSWQSNDESLHDMMQILDTTQYRGDIRNLFPWSMERFSTGTQYDGTTAHVLLVWGDEPTESAYVSFFGGGPVSVSLSDEKGFLLFHPTNTEILQHLMDYVRLNGTQLQ